MIPRTIMIADDDPTVTLILATALRKEGYKVTTAMDAMQATRLAFKNPPDAVVLDIQMPGGTGLDVLKKIKTSSNTGHVPVIAISGLKDPKLADTLRGLGADAFLHKPVDPAQLVAELKRLLETA